MEQVGAPDLEMSWAMYWHPGDPRGCATVAGGMREGHRTGSTKVLGGPIHVLTSSYVFVELVRVIYSVCFFLSLNLPGPHFVYA